MERLRFVVTIGLASLMAGPGDAAKPIAEQSKAFVDMLSCRAVADGPQRLACYDEKAGALGAAADRSDLIVVDRDQVEKAKRSLFGLSLPKFSLLGLGGRDDASQQELATTLKSAYQNAEGRWVIVVADGAVWLQIDDTPVRRPPHSGSAVVIRRASLGTYFVRCDGQLGFRARRQS